MQQLVSIWSGLDGRRRTIVAFATVAMFASILLLTRAASTPGMSLLYAGLEPGAAGDVVSALEQRDVRFEIRGGAIFVDSLRRDELRMTLAGDGLPANGAAGYELLDALSGFGTTSQMFDAAYWRAKEGELARTIVANPQVRMARVHISNPSAQPFRRDLSPTASVTLTPASGAIDNSQARALRYLVASAVSGMTADNVSVINGQTGQIIGLEDGVSGTTSANDRSAELRQRVERLLEAHVGAGNAVVEVSVETVTESESIVERRIDPDSRIAISTDVEERSNAAEDAGSGAVTVASNLPQGDAGGEGATSTSQNTETRERTNFEISETQREIIKTPGAIKRLTVAVLINDTVIPDTNGENTTVARTDAEMESLRELVASAVGFDKNRGDIITLKSMGFVPVEALGSGPGAGLFQSMNINVMSVIQIAILALVSLVLGLFVVRPILSSNRSSAVPQIGSVGSSGADTLDGQAQGLTLPPVLDGEIDDQFSGANLPALTQFEHQNPEHGDPLQRLRDLIDERQDETVEILRSWMEDKEELI